jgi:hypothetical protein
MIAPYFFLPDQDKEAFVRMVAEFMAARP